MAIDREDHTLTHLPILPESLLRQHHVYEPTDTRFRACARLLQALFRCEDRHLPIGFHVSPEGTRRRLGSRITAAAGRNGGNFLTPAIAALVQREVAYREIGAMVCVQRLYTNLLSSTAACFNVFGLLRLDLGLATRVLRRLCPDLARVEVLSVRFEHSPGRGSAALSGDFSAFDVFFAYNTPQGRTGFVAVECKYSESGQEPAPKLKPRHDELAVASRLFENPEHPALRANPVQQLFREHLLAYAMVLRGDYDEGRFITVAPQHNHQIQSAIARYKQLLVPALDQVTLFQAFTLEQVIEAIGLEGKHEYAQALYFRYVDWWRVDDALQAALGVPATAPRQANSATAQVAGPAPLKLIRNGRA